MIAMEPPVNITRRAFCQGTLALGTLVLADSTALLGWMRAAGAQAISPVELLQPSPLGDRQLGPDNAPVTIVEYASLTCPHCANFHKNVLPELKKRYIDTGKVRLIFREFALNPLDAGAIMLARCLDKDKYFDFVDVLFRSQDQWVVQKPIEPLLGIARQAGFTKERFDACLKNQKLLDDIEAQRNRAGEKFGVNFLSTEKLSAAFNRSRISKRRSSRISMKNNDYFHRGRAGPAGDSGAHAGGRFGKQSQSTANLLLVRACRFILRPMRHPSTESSPQSLGASRVGFTRRNPAAGPVPRCLGRLHS
jgi:protein-disulfide isomerase